jgi:hypothetical protein
MKIQSAFTRAIRPAVVGATAIATIALPQVARADESGISFWIPGIFGSLAAVSQTPGWSLGSIYYHTSVSAFGAAAAAREIQVGRFSPTVNVSLNASINGQADLLLLVPNYTFATPVLGGQLSLSMMAVFGRTSTQAFTTG